MEVQALVPYALATVIDIVIRPDFDGIPPNVQQGLIHLTNNLAAVLLMASGVGIVVSIIGLMVGHWLGSHQLGERFRGSLMVSAGSGALLFLAAAAANYSVRLFQ